MATTLYKFQSDLTGLIALNKGLKEAQVNLHLLKTGTIQYAAQNKRIAAMSGTFHANTAAIRGTNVAATRLNATGNRMVGIFKSASIAIVAAFAFRAIIGGITGVIKIFAKFEAQMAAVKAISQASTEEFEELTRSAKELGNTTVFTATQVAQLQEEFARLGFKPEQILAAQTATLALAAATGENLSSAASIAGSSLRAFQYEAEQIVRVTNVMGESFTGSALNLERFTQSMKFAAPVAKTAGFTIEETSAMMMTLADAGLHGSIAGNALKNIFLRLGDANSKLNQSIGYTVQGLPQLIKEMEKMKEATFGLTDATELLDKRSAPAFLVLLRNIEELKLNLDTLNEAEGAISRMASIRLDTLEGDFTLLKSASEGLGLAIGDAFDFQMRKAIQNFTGFIQGITSSDKAIEKIRRAFNAVAVAIKFMVYRLAALKVLSIASAITTANLSMMWKRYLVSIRLAAKGTTGFNRALKMTKAAIASTGIGLLIVGVGMLAGYMMELSDETDEAAHALNRLQDSMAKELSDVTKLNEVSSERHDKMREIVSTYKELLHNIDIEILNNEEMIRLTSILNDTKLTGYRNLAAEQDAETKRLKDKMNQDKIDSDERIALIIKEKKIRTATISSGYSPGGMPITSQKITGTTEQLVEEEKEKAKKLADIDQKKLDEATKNAGEFHALAKTEFDNLVELNKLSLEQESNLRLELRAEYNVDLENFRTYKFNKQKLIKKEADQKLADIEEGKRLAEYEVTIAEAKKKNLVKVEKETIDARDKLKSKMNKQALDFGDKFKKEGEDTNVMLSEYRKYVSNLTTVLNKSGKAYSGSALSGFRLNKTKNRLKELMKIKVKQINDSFKQEKAALQAEFDIKKEQYDRERLLMLTNMRSIKDMQEASSLKQMRADLKANRTKYEVLKNIDETEWKRLMDGRGVQKTEYLAFLNKMHDEEMTKWKTNHDLLIQLRKDFDNEMLKVIIDNAYKRKQIGLDEQSEDLRNMDEDLINFQDNQAKRLKHFKDQQAKERAHQLETSLGDRALMAQFDADERKREEDLTDFKRKQNQERLATISETYQQMAGMIMEMSARVAAAKIADLESDFEEQTTHEDNVFRRKLEIAEAAGGDTEAMQEAHDDKMNALERKKDEKIRVIKKKQFMMEKANNVAMALINGAQAIAKVTAQTGIGAIVAAPLTSALIAAQVGMILSQKFVGAKGGIIPGGDDKFAEGGMVVGNSHAQGGVKFAVGGRVAELEGGEAVINKRSTALFKPQLSAMNSHNGYGKKFAQGGITPGTRAALDASKGTWSANDIAGLISDSINQQQVYVTESDITSTQDTVSISEGLSSIFK